MVSYKVARQTQTNYALCFCFVFFKTSTFVEHVIHNYSSFVGRQRHFCVPYIWHTKKIRGLLNDSTKNSLNSFVASVLGGTAQQHAVA